jgi:two-component sensor histidine kinase
MDTWCEEDKTRFPGLEEYLFRHGEWHGEIRGIDAEGVPRTCESRVKMIEIAGEPAILAVGRDITERKRMEEQVRNALREKETLLREIHHRVKNNMQIISTLLKLQSKNVQEGRTQALFRESQNRILSMAMIHEKLYQSEGIHKIDLKDYIHDLAHEVVASFGETRRGRITLTTDIHDIALGMDTAIPCGLILIELVSNSLKYAFPENRVGEIRIVFHSLGSAGFELTVADNGIGLPEDMDIHEQKSLGLRLVSDLAKYQLEGEMDVEGETGTTVRVQFPGSKGGSGEDG